MPLLILISIIAVICLMLYQEERLKAQLKQRTEQLLHDYPGFVYRMVLMLGAGMTSRRSWYQLMEDYEKEGGGQEKWLYKELRYAHIQMQSGVPEIQAYIEFGKRTELHQYIKFMQLLTQYIRRGSRGFYYEETAVGVVEIILILVVLISLVVIFKKQLTSIVNNIFKKITTESNKI